MYTTNEVQDAIWPEERWNYLGKKGKKDAVFLKGRAVELEVVDSNAYDEDNSLSSSMFTVIKIGTQFFKKTGWKVWNPNITEVKPITSTATVYE